MNSNLAVPASTDSRRSSVSVPIIKAIVFQIGSLNLAIRIESVHKILRHTSIYTSGLNGVGIAHVDDGEVVVLDLQWRLFRDKTIDTSNQATYLIVVKNSVNELQGIPVNAVPSLIDIPVATLRVLPDSYRHADTLGIASHVAVIPQAQNSLTVFLLSLDQQFFLGEA